MKECFILLGSNIGTREKYLTTARQRLDVLVGAVCKASSVYETAAWGIEDQEAYLNQVVSLSTILAPEDVLVKALEIEKELGRIRRERWGARVIDIDVLFYEDQIVQSERLTIPHPELHNRLFTLIPLAEIAHEMVHPVFQKSIGQLLEACPDGLEVRKFSNL